MLFANLEHKGFLEIAGVTVLAKDLNNAKVVIPTRSSFRLFLWLMQRQMDLGE